VRVRIHVTKNWVACQASGIGIPWRLDPSVAPSRAAPTGAEGPLTAPARAAQRRHTAGFSTTSRGFGSASPRPRGAPCDTGLTKEIGAGRKGGRDRCVEPDRAVGAARPKEEGRRTRVVPDPPARHAFREEGPHAAARSMRSSPSRVRTTSISDSRRSTGFLPVPRGGP